MGRARGAAPGRERRQEGVGNQLMVIDEGATAGIHADHIDGGVFSIRIARPAQVMDCIVMIRGRCHGQHRRTTREGRGNQTPLDNAAVESVVRSD